MSAPLVVNDSAVAATPVRLARLELREIRLPLREPFRISSGEVWERRILLLQLEDASGATVWAECVAGELPNYSPETVDTAWWAMREWLAPRLLGIELAHPGEAHARLARGIVGHAMARAALEMGCWALSAAKGGLPLARLLGGTRQRVAVGISLGIQRSPEALAERVARAAGEGYARVKVKIQPGADVDYVRAARAALGSHRPLTADANSAYTLADADHLAQLDDFDLAMLEQPLGQDDLVRHAALQRRLRTPLCLDESITGAERCEDMLTLGSGRVVNVKPGRVGGFAESRRIHDLCMAASVPVWCGGMLESGVGRAYNVALASLPGFTMPGDLSPSARYWERDVVSPEWTMDAAGTMGVPLDAPGIGVAVDAARVEDLTVRLEEVRGAD
jgi:O-succinylbenzoate synthase